MSEKIQVPATLEGVSTLKDGGVSVRLHTQELNTQEKALVLEYQGKFGWFLFSESEHKSDDVKELELIRKDTGGKSPSQRLRSVLYVLYQQRGESTVTFEQFYDKQMEKFINRIKDELS